MAVIEYTVGAAGTGKSFIRCAKFLVDEWLPYHEGNHISNFPLEVDKIVEYVSKKYKDIPDCTEERLYERLQVIPQAVLDSWIRLESGPWDYFKDHSFDGCHISIDEIHNFCPASAPKAYLKQWNDWLGEIRHEGATIEFLTQNEAKVSKSIEIESGLRRELTGRADKVNPLTGCPYSVDWNLIARFTGKYRQKTTITTKRRIGKVWKPDTKYPVIVTLDPFYFQFYDSYAAAFQSGKKGKAAEQPYKRLGRFRFWMWYLQRAFIPFIVCRLTVVSIGLFFLFSMVSNLFAGNHIRALAGHQIKQREAQGINQTSKLKKEGKEELKEDVKISCLGKDFLILSNGKYYELGEEFELITDGKKETKNVKAINFKKRLIVYSDGTFERMY